MTQNHVIGIDLFLILMVYRYELRVSDVTALGLSDVSLTETHLWLVFARIIKNNSCP